MGKDIFNPRIFRDIKDVDYEKTPMSVIFRVMRYGDLIDVQQLKSVYNTNVLVSFLKKR